jgi:hypothetical protein
MTNCFVDEVAAVTVIENIRPLRKDISFSLSRSTILLLIVLSFL